MLARVPRVCVLWGWRRADQRSECRESACSGGGDGRRAGASAASLRDETYQYSARRCSDTSRAITPGHWLGQKQRRLHPNTHIRYFRRRRWTTDQSGSTQRSDRAQTRPESESRVGDIRSRCENIVSPDVLRSYSARRVITVASARQCDSGLHVEDRSKATCERLPVMHWCRQCSGSAQLSRAGSSVVLHASLQLLTVCKRLFTAMPAPATQFVNTNRFSKS